MKRRTLLAASVGLTLAHPLGALAQSLGKRRNVLLVISDDQGLDAGCYGVPIHTPRLDAFAKASTLFTQGYATVSSCSPSRAVINTGLQTHANGMYGLAHDVHNQGVLDGVKTLPALLRAGGYATCLVGKKHIRPDSAFPYEAELAPERAGHRDVKELADEAMRFIGGAGSRPFFVTVAYSDPHRAAGGYGNRDDWPGVREVHYDPAKVPVPATLPDLPEVRHDLAAYYEAISRLDTGFGMLLDGLKAAGHAGDTLVIFLSDNGRPFPNAKTNLYDGGLHLPLIVHAPGARPAVSDAMASWVDIAPTVLEWTGVQGPEYPLHGRSLLPVLGHAHFAGRGEVFASHDFHEINQYYPMRAIRTRTHSYIVNLAWQLPYPIAGDVGASESWKAIAANPAIKLGKRTQAAYLQRPAEELYDLRSDPDEMVNLAPGNPPILAELRERLHAFRARTKDPWLGDQTDPYSHMAK